MHSSRFSNAYSSSGPPDSRAGTLDLAERWWRNRYDEIAEYGYQLRPRYKPNWQPSWLKSGKVFYTVEDGQPSRVCGSD